MYMHSSLHPGPAEGPTRLFLCGDSLRAAGVGLPRAFHALLVGHARTEPARGCGQSEADEQREARAAARRAGRALWPHAVQLHDGAVHRGREGVAHNRQRHLCLEVSAIQPILHINLPPF